MAGRNEGDGTYCERCLHRAARCATCGRPLPGDFWEIRGAPGVYCQACTKEAPPCSSCQTPIRDGVMMDGRYFCRRCVGDLLTDPEVFQAIYDRATAGIADAVGLRLQKRPPLIIENAASMDLERTAEMTREGLCGLFVRDERGRTSIHVLSYLTERKALAVLAHELAHAWQAENCPDAQGARLREGFAEWVAWKTLEGFPGCAGEREIIESRADEYGAGFRVFAELERTRGVDAVIWYATSAQTSLAATR
jgi:hypothetical protein